MWLIEKSPDEYTFMPVNTNHMQYIDRDSNDDKSSFAIKFCFVAGDSNKWIKWWFKKEVDRDHYYNKMREKLPTIDLGIDDITL